MPSFCFACWLSLPDFVMSTISVLIGRSWVSHLHWLYLQYRVQIYRAVGIDHKVWYYKYQSSNCMESRGRFLQVARNNLIQLCHLHYEYSPGKNINISRISFHLCLKNMLILFNGLSKTDYKSQWRNLYTWLKIPAESPSNDNIMSLQKNLLDIVVLDILPEYNVFLSHSGSIMALW